RRRSCADHCRSRILELVAALRRSGRKGDVVQKRFRGVSSNPALIDLKGAPERRCEGTRGGNKAGGTSPEKPRRSFRNGAALTFALVDSGIRTHRHAGKSKNLRCRSAFIYRRIGLVPGA